MKSFHLCSSINFKSNLSTPRHRYKIFYIFNLSTYSHSALFHLFGVVHVILSLGDPQLFNPLPQYIDFLALIPI